jgi:hypothetical protein
MGDLEPSGRIRDIRRYRPSLVGLVRLVCTPLLMLGATEVYGALGTGLLALTWLVLFALGCRWFMSAPWRVVVVAVVSMLAWLAVVLVANAPG